MLILVVNVLAVNCLLPTLYCVKKCLIIVSKTTKSVLYPRSPCFSRFEELSKPLEINDEISNEEQDEIKQKRQDEIAAVLGRARGRVQFRCKVAGTEHGCSCVGWAVLAVPVYCRLCFRYFVVY